ncbi:MAG: isomerizing glutamine--fructose-6-phosphate transaminase, partial [Pseudomonadota bacterium]
MCGIVGALSDHEVSPILLEALKRLEYRGYDSAGIATLEGGLLDRRRAVGKLINLSDRLVHEPLRGKAGIGHTRWATHGGPTETNAHPHRAGPVAVVHNGIIENYRDLRAELSAKGVAFQSDTDTETVALLTEHFLRETGDPRAAVIKTLAKLEGAFALCFLFEGQDDLLVAARKGSPLAIGHGDGQMYVGSDAIALSPLTTRVTYLEEGDYAFITRDSVEIYDEHGRRANREVRDIQASVTQIDKGGHRHFMIKEIYEQPTVLAAALSHYSTGEKVSIPEGEVDFSDTDRLIMVACGTAYYACAVAKYWFEQLAGLPVDVDIASEFRYRE